MRSRERSVMNTRILANSGPFAGLCSRISLSRTALASSVSAIMSSARSTRRSGSAASRSPIPWQAVYAASKAYTRFLARALHEEERKRGVNVLLMSPGNMNTEMNVQASATGKLGRLPYLDLKRETARTLMMAERGHATYTPMLFYKLYRIFTKLMPSALAVKVTSFED